MLHVTAKPASANLLDVFRKRCWAKAMLVREGLATLQDSVDALQNAAVAYGLVPNDEAQDKIQQIMAEAFAIVHTGEDEKVERWEADDAKRPKPVQQSKPPYRTPQATIDAFWYAVRLRNRKRLQEWLNNHPNDAPFLRAQLRGKQ
jgi:hypothetical protein